jgi:hypothetical protein
MIFRQGKKYNIEDATIDWTFIGSTTTGCLYSTYTFVDTKNWKRKQFKNTELAKLNINISNEN